MSPQPSSSKSPESSSSTLLPSELIRDSKKNSPNKNKTEKKNPKNIQFANRTEIQKYDYYYIYYFYYSTIYFYLLINLIFLHIKF